jgi:hypothetical protein
MSFQLCSCYRLVTFVHIQVATHLACVANYKLGKKEQAVPCKSVYFILVCK